MATLEKNKPSILLSEETLPLIREAANTQAVVNLLANVMGIEKYSHDLDLLASEIASLKERVDKLERENVHE